MQGDGLGTQEVVAGGEVLGDRDIHLATASVEVLGSPVVVTARGTPGRPGVLEDLEPGGVSTFGRGGVVDGGHVDKDRTVVGTSNGLVGAAAVVGLLVHLDGHSAARGDITLGGDWGGSRVASHVLGGDVLDGGVAQGNTSTGRVVVRPIDLCATLVEAPRLLVLEQAFQDGEIIPKAVGRLRGQPRSLRPERWQARQRMRTSSWRYFWRRVESKRVDQRLQM